MLNSIEFIDNYRTFNIGDKFKFVAGANIIVGDQGTGKSSLLRILTDTKCKFTDIANVTCSSSTYYYLDFEKHNPRTKNNIDSLFQLSVKFCSHGESNLSIVEKLTQEISEDNVVIIVDEVDMALSIKSCYALVKLIRKLTRNKHQVLVAVHNPIIIESFPKVLSIEHKQWMTSKDFITSHTPKSKHIQK